MSKAEDAQYRPSEGFRGDHDPQSPFNTKGRLKSHINDAGDLVPPNPEGKYKGRDVTIVEHLNGGFSKAAKANSPYTSFGSNGVIDKYGGKEIKVDLDGLRDAISRNEVKGVTVIEHSQVLQAIEEETNIPKGIRTMLRNFAVADKEILVKGVIPKRFVQVKAD